MTIKDEIAPEIAHERSGNIDQALLDTLMEDEHVIHAATISRGIYWKGAFFAVIALLCLVSPGLLNLGVFFGVVAAVALIFAWLTKHYLLLVLTNRRVFIRHGIIQLDTVEVRLNRIESLEVERPPMGRFLGMFGAGYGRIVVSGTGSRVTIVPYIEDATAFRKSLDKIMPDFQ
jgi:membrane protein YdbS with pleckstrin-like domain